MSLLSVTIKDYRVREDFVKIGDNIYLRAKRKSSGEVVITMDVPREVKISRYHNNIHSGTGEYHVYGQENSEFNTETD